jgi:O-antigen/teichoic acid export membrane protein
VLIVGTAFSQLLPIISLPLLSAYYNPTSFASLSIFMSLGAILSIASTGRYELAILHPREEKDALALVFLSCLASFFISAAVGLAMLGFYHFGGAKLFAIPLSIDFLFLVPLSILGYSMMQVLNYWYSRKDRFTTVSVLRITQSILIVGCGLLFGWLRWKEMGLVYAFAIGGIFVIGSMLFLLFENRNFFSWQAVVVQARKYRNYPQHLMTTALMDTAAVQAPIFFLAASFDSFLVGSYGFANRIVMAPVSLISASIGQVYYQQIAGAGKSAMDIIKKFRRTLFVLSVLSVVLFGGLYLLGQDLVDLFFSKEWQRSGAILSMLSLALLIRFIVSPLSMTLVALDRFTWVSLWQTVYLISTLLFFLFVPTLGFRQMLYFFALHESVHYIFYLLIIVHALRKADVKGSTLE